MKYPCPGIRAELIGRFLHHLRPRGLQRAMLMYGDVREIMSIVTRSAKLQQLKPA